MSSIANILPSSELDIDEEAYTLATQLFSISNLPMTLKAAIHLELLDIISKAGPNMPLSAKEVVAHLRTKNSRAPAMVESILRLLASYHVLTCSMSTDDAGCRTLRYGATPICNLFTKNEDGVSMANMSLMMQEMVYMESWNYMKDAVLEGGIPFDRANGMSMFEYCGMDQRFGTMFKEGMRGFSTFTMKKILELYSGFNDVKVLVDVGGGIGTSLNLIVSKYPHIKGINFDLPIVIVEAPSMPGIKHVGGDMINSIPNGDAILMKWILHNWDDKHCLKILKNCCRALPENGKVVIIESVLPVVPVATPAVQSVFHLDLSMQALFGSRVRTETEIEAFAKEAGFSGFKVLFNYSINWVIEFSKQA